jgi:putative transposase
VLKISKSGFYAWLARAMSDRERTDIALTAKIHAIHRRSREAYGAPMIHAELADVHAIRVGRKRVARLMRLAGLRGVQMKRFVRTTIPDVYSAVALDRVDRRFEAPGPDRLWVADITYIPTWSGFLYLAMVLDVWSRRIVGWAMESHLRTELVLSATNMALAQHRPKSVIHHSDPRLPVHEPRLRQALPGNGRDALDGLGGGRLRQCHGGELLRHPGARSTAAKELQDAGRSPNGGVRVDRRLVQPASASLVLRLSVTHQL